MKDEAKAQGQVSREVDVANKAVAVLHEKIDMLAGCLVGVVSPSEEGGEKELSNPPKPMVVHAEEIALISASIREARKKIVSLLDNLEL